MAKTVLVPIADGIEEIEAVCIIDTLRRSGAVVTVASVKALRITASRGLKLIADAQIADCTGKEFDVIALPGGMPGAEHLRDSKELEAMLKEQKQSGRIFAAICASPAIVFVHHGLLAGKKATCYPSFQDKLESVDTESQVVVDGNCVTSCGPGTALMFALKLVELLFGREKSCQIADQMLVKIAD